MNIHIVQILAEFLVKLGEVKISGTVRHFLGTSYLWRQMMTVNGGEQGSLPACSEQSLHFQDWIIVARWRFWLKTMSLSRCKKSQVWMLAFLDVRSCGSLHPESWFLFAPWLLPCHGLVGVVCFPRCWLQVWIWVAYVSHSMGGYVSEPVCLSPCSCSPATTMGRASLADSQIPQIRVSHESVSASGSWPQPPMRNKMFNVICFWNVVSWFTAQCSKS